MRALLIDAYDSFIYIIDQYLRSLQVETSVLRNDQVAPESVLSHGCDFIVLGPGPGHPKDAGYVDILREVGGRLPILGVCLGHQAIGLAYGGTVSRAPRPVHGKDSIIHHDKKGCFKEYQTSFKATRYHSLIVERESLPACLTASAASHEDDCIMGLRHTSLPIESVQFHPESIGTDKGLQIFTSFIETHVTGRHHP